MSTLARGEAHIVLVHTEGVSRRVATGDGSAHPHSRARTHDDACMASGVAKVVPAPAERDHAVQHARRRQLDTRGAYCVGIVAAARPSAELTEPVRRPAARSGDIGP